MSETRFHVRVERDFKQGDDYISNRHAPGTFNRLRPLSSSVVAVVVRTGTLDGDLGLVLDRSF